MGACGLLRPAEAFDSYAKLVERNGIILSLTNVHLGGESKLENTEGLWIQHLADAHTQTIDRMLSSVAQGDRARELIGAGTELVKAAGAGRGDEWS